MGMGIIPIAIDIMKSPVMACRLFAGVGWDVPMIDETYSNPGQPGGFAARLDRHLLADTMEAAAANQDMVRALAHHRAIGEKRLDRFDRGGIMGRAV